MRALAAALAGVVLAAPGATAADSSLGRLAFARDGALVVLDLDTRRERVLVARGARGPVRFSADGRYVAFSRGVVAAEGAQVLRFSGTWAPHGHLLARITPAGGIRLSGPGLPPRRLVGDGFGAQSLAFDPSRKLLAVSRAFMRDTATPRNREIWVVDLRTGARRLVYRAPAESDRTPLVARFPTSGFVLFTQPLLPAISINLDGLPLEVVAGRGGQAERVLPAVLRYDEFLADCGRRVVVAAGLDRFTTHAKRLVLIGPPRWRPRELSADRSRSWVSPSCSSDGRWAVASAGRNWIERRFGLERRSIWLLSLDGRVRRRLTSPPRGTTDELPRFAGDDRSILFVRTSFLRTTGPAELAARGQLFLWRDGQVEGPLADLGATDNYYGRYGWAEQMDWHR